MVKVLSMLSTSILTIGMIGTVWINWKAKSDHLDRLRHPVVKYVCLTEDSESRQNFAFNNLIGGQNLVNEGARQVESIPVYKIVKDGKVMTPTGIYVQFREFGQTPHWSAEDPYSVFKKTLYFNIITFCIFLLTTTMRLWLWHRSSDG
jgi:hypothetical protein